MFECTIESIMFSDSDEEIAEESELKLPFAPWKGLKIEGLGDLEINWCSDDHHCEEAIITDVSYCPYINGFYLTLKSVDDLKTTFINK